MPACPRSEEAIAYRLRELTAEEMRSYQAHLNTCLACRLKLQEVQETLDLLPLAVPDIAPPPALKQRIAASIAAEARPAKPRQWTATAWAAAAIIALVVGGYSLLEMRDLRHQLTAITKAPPVELTVRLQGTDNAPGASGRVVVAREAGGARISLQAQGLPALQPGEAYQLWLIKDGKRRSGGVFVVDGTGAGGLATWLPDAAEFDALGITREPDAIGQQPRGQKVLGSV